MKQHLKATPQQFTKMVSRQVDISQPEHKLWLAVVDQAVTDAHNGERGARRFLQDKNNLAYRMLGLDGDFMVEQFRKHAHWGDTIK